MMKKIAVLFLLIGVKITLIAQFAPPAGELGTTAIHKDSIVFVNWASEVVDFQRGLEDIAFPGGLYASFGDSSEALGYAEGTSVNVVSLGDLGSIVLTFPFSIRNEIGPDFAVFENSFADNYLEFAHVEVSSDGERFVRFPSISTIQTDVQTATYGVSDASKVHNLAGKYRQGFGTPFDLEDLVDSAGIDLNAILFVRIIDVVGSIDPLYGTRDSEGNLINDPYKTDFESGGFDLDAIGVIHDNNPSLGLELMAKMSVSVFPNPTNGAVFIQTDSPVKWVRILDLEGTILFDKPALGQFNFMDENFSEGIYLLEVEAESSEIIRTRIVYL